MGLGLTHWYWWMCMGCWEGFREVVDDGLADLSVHIVSSFSCLPTLAVAVTIFTTMARRVTARELAK